MNPTALYGFIAHGVILGALVALLPLGGKRRIIGLVAVPVALASGAAALMHGIVGTPSLTLLVIEIWHLAAARPSLPGWRPALALIAFALPFYAMALGVGPLDPYAAGYQPQPLLAASLPLAALLWWRRLDRCLLVLAVDLAGYASGLFANLWDVLFDPLLVLLALLLLVMQLVRPHRLPR